MIIESEFKESFKEQLLVTEDVSEKWGYSLQSKQYLPHQKDTHVSRSIPMINTKLRPMNLEKKKLYESQRLMELNKEIVSNQIQKKLDKKSKQKGQKQINVVEFMNDKIQEYNYIVEHNHIIEKQKDHLEMQKVKQIKPKSDTEKLLDLINENKEKVRKSDNLEGKIKINNKISKLYHKYSNVMYRTEDPPMIELGLRKSEGLSSNTSALEEFNDLKSEKSKNQLKVKPLYFELNINNRHKRKKINIKEPFVEQDYLSQLKGLDKGIKKDRETAEVYRYRISEIFQKRKSSLLSDVEKSVKEHKTQLTDRTADLKHDGQYSRLYKSFNQHIDGDEEENDEKRLTKYLKGKSHRYTKPSGDKFLLKYDSAEKSKELLNKKSILQIRQSEQQPFKYKPMYQRKLVIPEGLSEENKQVMRSMIEEEDDLYYWTTCRNQQLNLLLKSKKKKK